MTSPKKRKPHRISVGFVELPGFEPGITGPESVVLPLHHSSIVLVVFDGAKVELIFAFAKFFCDFFYTFVFRGVKNAPKPT